VLRLDRDGGLVRQRDYGGAPTGGVGFGSNAVGIERSDSGFVLLGEVGGAAFDTIVLQIGEDGALEETATFDAHSSAAGFDDVKDLLLTQDGGVVVAGTNDSELWLLKMGGDGSWHKAYALSAECLQARPYFSGDYLAETADGSLVVAASAGSCSGSTSCRAWLMELTKTGAIAFDQTSSAQSANANATIYGLDVFERSTAATVLELLLTVADITAEVGVFVTDVVEARQAP